MTVKIGHASIDENGHARGGAAGDQTGREVYTRNWYNKPWIAVIRPNNETVAEKIAKAMEQACANNNIGYDQNQRTSLFQQAEIVGWDLSKITVKCETDCSALVAVCVNAAGVAVSKDIYTGNEKQALINTGKFKELTEKKYLASSENLKRGDILLASGHTAVVLSNGSNVASGVADATQVIKVEAAQKKDTKLAGIYTTTANLNIRTGAGTGKKIIDTLKKGTKVKNYGYYNEVNGEKWLYVEVNGVTGYCSMKYLKK